MFGRKNQDERAKAEFLNELAAQRESAQSLVDRYEAEVKNARSAALAVGKAREERDEYRRVLAAAIATERRRVAQVEGLEQERQRLEAMAHEEMRSASHEAARGEELRLRLDQLEHRLTDELAARERALGDAADRAWAEREAARDEFVRLVAAHRQEVTTSLERTAAEVARLKRSADSTWSSMALAAAAPRPPVHPGVHTIERIGPDPLARVIDLRARLLIGFSIASTLCVVALIPLAVLSVSDPERALFVHLASGVGPWQLVVLVVFFSAVAVALLSWAIRDLRRLAQQQASFTPATTPGSSAGSPSGSGPGSGPEPASKSGSKFAEGSSGVPASNDALIPRPTPAGDSTANEASDAQRNPNAGVNGTPRL
ncbi:MAG: hypothetical protein ACJAQ3_002729 [Planctomycetota bacterium]|jgi:hypothetical protein